MAILALGLFLVLLGRPAAAATYTWASAAPDGSGIWNTSNTNKVWLSGVTYVSWPTSGGTSTAVFGTGNDTAGTVTVSGAGVSVGAMTFNAPGTGTYTITGGLLTLGSTATMVTMNADASIGAILIGSGGLTETGYGTLELMPTSSNTYTGMTTVSDSSSSGDTILRLSTSGALPGSNLKLDGGVVELAAGDFTRSLGSGTGQVQFTSNGGGFAAVGANRVVNLGGVSGPLTWGSGSFLPSGAPLILGSPSDDSTVDFQNPLNLGSGTQTIQVNSGYATVDAQLSGVLSGSGGLSLPGYGTLRLTASNTYTGTTTVSGGILRLSNAGALPGGTAATSTGSNLTLDGGVVELAAGDFTRDLGSGQGQVQFTNNGGGFAAVGANRVVNLSSSATLTWGATPCFLPSGGTLTLGSPSADSTLDFQNPMDLGSGTQTVQVYLGSASVNARLSGVLSDSGGLTVTGGGNLELTTSNTYTGATTVSGGILRLSNAGALPGGTAATSTGSNLTLDGGVVELAAGDFTRSLGSGPGQVQFTSNGGGFSAVGANRVVNLQQFGDLDLGRHPFLSAQRRDADA